MTFKLWHTEAAATEPEAIEPEAENDLLSIVKSIANQNLESCEKSREIQLGKSEIKGLELLQSDRFQEQKALQSVQELVQSPEKLQHAFKCMAYFCSFTTDSAQDFLIVPRLKVWLTSLC